MNFNAKAITCAFHWPEWQTDCATVPMGRTNVIMKVSFGADAAVRCASTELMSWMAKYTAKMARTKDSSRPSLAA